MPRALPFTPIRDLLHGLTQISKATGYHPKTLKKYSRKHDFPLVLDPQGRYLSSHSLINAWIMARRRAQIRIGLLPIENRSTVPDHGTGKRPSAPGASEGR